MKKLPSDEKYDLVSQGKRAIVPVALNIAEGSGRHTSKDFSAFVNRAVTSLLEVDAVLKIAIELGYLTREDCESVSALIEKKYFKLVAFDESLRKNPTRKHKNRQA